MKTAVEWFASVLSQAGPITEDDFNSLVVQAKEMEKEQIMKAFYDGCFDQNSWRDEEYYNETFKQQEQ